MLIKEREVSLVIQEIQKFNLLFVKQRFGLTTSKHNFEPEEGHTCIIYATIDSSHLDIEIIL